MVNVIQGKTINEVVYKELEKIITEGNRTPSRNGDISTIYNVFMTLENPRARHLSLQGRKNNIFATIAETFWVFAGDDKVDPLLSFFLPRAADFSDDGKTWRGAYGPRIFGDNKALEDLVQQFKNEGIFTRRGVISIFNPDLDTQVNLEAKYGIESTKDRPCNLLMDFFVTPDKRLHMNLKQRSGDVLWGHGSINIFEFTLLHEVVLNLLKAEVDSELTLGEYNHHVTNLHLYDFSGSQGYAVLENKLKQRLGVQNYQKVYTPNNAEDFIKFNQRICRVLTEAIETKETDYNKLLSKMSLVAFASEGNGMGLDFDENLYWQYAKVTCAYVCAKNRDLPKGIVSEYIQVNLDGVDQEFKMAIQNSSFRKFTLTN